MGSVACRPAIVVAAAVLTAPAATAAPRLLGAVLRANGVGVRIVEVEAYDGVGVDAASHAFRGQTARNTPMFGPAGTLYVYFTYGMHWCANIACDEVGVGAAVLLRAGEVVEGVDVAAVRANPKLRPHQYGQGPARLAKILQLTGEDSGTSVLDNVGPARLTLDSTPADQVLGGPRIGIKQATDVPWRFWIDSPSVSGPAGAKREAVADGGTA